jgi:hypothetical protein
VHFAKYLGLWFLTISFSFFTDSKLIFYSPAYLVLDCCQNCICKIPIFTTLLNTILVTSCGRILSKLESGRGKWEHHLIPTEDPDKADVLVDSDSDPEPDPSPPLPGFSFKSPNKGGFSGGLTCWLYFPPLFFFLFCANLTIIHRSRSHVCKHSLQVEFEQYSTRKIICFLPCCQSIPF